MASSKNFKSNTLAPVQRQTLEYLRGFIADKGYAPTLKDISKYIGVRSPSTAHFHLERLADKGFIRRGDDGMIELIDSNRPQLGPTAVPLVGVIAAGVPMDAFEDKSTMIDVPSNMVDRRGEVFCLQVSGDSMIDDHICNGDIVVVRKQDTANKGQTIVALLNDGSATLKTYSPLKNGKVMLIPANRNMAPMTLDEVTVQGVLIGLIRYVQ